MLEQMQQDAIDDRVSLGMLLRKCRVLAARLGSRPLESWVLHESNGYPNDVELPTYRVWSVTLRGDFSGPFQSGLRNALIPSTCVPLAVRDLATTFQCRQSISSLESTLQENRESGIFFAPTPSDLAPYLGQKVYERMNCIQVRAEFSIGQVHEVLNTVRNRVLEFVTELWKAAPEAGNVGVQSSKATPEIVRHIFNTTVFGGTIGQVGAAANSPISVTVNQGDWESLAALLEARGIPPADIGELKAAVSEDGPPTSGKLGPRVGAWLGKMIGKAANGAWDIGVAAGTTLLTAALSRYFGLDAQE